jgi:hypothetical protein
MASGSQVQTIRDLTLEAAAVEIAESSTKRDDDNAVWPARETTQAGCVSRSLFLRTTKRFERDLACLPPQANSDCGRCRFTVRNESYIRAGWLWPALWLLVAAVSGETIRVTSWNLSNWSETAPISASNHLDIGMVAAELRRLEPDVILLQGVPDWQTCLHLTWALKPADYTITICSAAGHEQLRASEAGAITNQEELKLSYETRIRQTKADLEAAEKRLAQSQSALGNIGRELTAVGVTNWMDVTPDVAKEYGDTSRQIETFGDQERELRYRGYKESHPLVQAVRGQLRIFASRKAELDRNFPTLKYLVEGTNTPNWALARQLEENRSLNLRVASFQSAIQRDQEQLSKIIGGLAQAAVRAADNPSEANGSERAHVAILSRQKAYFSRSYAWTSTRNADCGGFAFSAMQLSKQRIGCISADFGTNLNNTGSARQLLNEIGSIRKWEENQVEAFLVGCAFCDPKKGTAERPEEAIRVLVRGGFSDASSGLGGEQGGGGSRGMSRTDWILVESSGLVLNPQLTASGLTCDIELDPAKVTAGRLARVEAQTRAPLRELQRQDLSLVWTGILVFAAVSCLALGWMIGRRRRSRKPGRLLAAPAERGLTSPSSYTVIVAPTSITGSAPDPAAIAPVVPTVHVDTPGPGPTQSGSWEQRALVAEHRARQAEEVLRKGLLPHLSRWMREKLLRRLLSDRGQLLAAQEEATRKVMAVDARLSKLEAQIQQQTRVYVKRIEELTSELLAAKEENREFIRAKITQVKIEMEAARKKILEQQSKTAGY